MMLEVQLKPEIHQTLKQVVQVIGGGRFSLVNEKETQLQIFQLLQSQDFPGTVEREVRLSGRDIVDIMIDGRIAIEVKLKGHQKMDIFKQLSRYAKYEWVEAIVLVTNQAMGLPAEIEGKPAYYISLGRAWL